MDAIIKKILEIEQKAQQIVDDADQEKQKIDEALELEIQDMEQEIHSKVERKIRQIREREMQEAQSRIKEINSKVKQQTESMIRYAAEKKDEWEDLLMNRIIGR
ncbi:hypothetical protein [Petroclostridium sp. X23]|uniref:hypothetical protein n=1 Tax=Petroclostridium sp. X23 TaxID=3045146 RepID=UPI0024AD917B|nr:hypothetical protein [Petroclostridium sp. X23]WHH61226.1 hypothetical protein QKW49_11205 [Petroclostridium sp. X23]